MPVRNTGNSDKTIRILEKLSLKGKHWLQLNYLKDHLPFVNFSLNPESGGRYLILSVKYQVHKIFPKINYVKLSIMESSNIFQRPFCS